MSISGGQFLHQRNPQMHMSGPVELASEQARSKGERIPNEPAAKIETYLGNLTRHSLVAEIPGDEPTMAGELIRRRQRQIEARIIAMTPENAHAFAKFEAKIAREEGAGFDPNTVPDDKKIERLRIQREDQRKQLTEWVNYLTGPDTDYPTWFKYYTLDAVTNLTKFDESKQKFGKRSEGSFALFPELHSDSLAIVYSALTKQLNGDPIDIPNANPAVVESIRQAAKSGNFAKLYAEANKLGFAITPELRANLNGQWRKYEQSDKREDGDRLADDIARYRTGWCTAGRETAYTQLRDGDFYVFYTPDEHGRKNVPRVAIRMEQGKVREVRGVNPKQHMEVELADTVLEKVKELPGGAEYVRTAEDMKQLTAIEKKVTANPDVELTSRELRLLYELDYEVQGFGYEKDPRIGEIRSLRGERDIPDLARVLPESMRRRLRASYAAYKEVAEKLGVTEIIPAYRLNYLFYLKDKEWQESGVYGYIAERLVKDDTRFNLVATPNIEVSEDQIIALAKDFGADYTLPTHIDDSYPRGHYSGRELSGNSGSAEVRLSLIPSRIDEEFGRKLIDEQRRRLREYQARRPEFHARVPSLLDAVTYWFTLRAQGEKLNERGIYGKTSICHFDLEPQIWEDLDNEHLVPQSLVFKAGRPGLAGFRTDVNELEVRLAIG